MSEMEVPAGVLGVFMEVPDGIPDDQIFMEVPDAGPVRERQLVFAFDTFIDIPTVQFPVGQDNTFEYQFKQQTAGSTFIWSTKPATDTNYMNPNSGVGGFLVQRVGLGQALFESYALNTLYDGKEEFIFGSPSSVELFLDNVSKGSVNVSQDTGFVTGIRIGKPVWDTFGFSGVLREIKLSYGGALQHHWVIGQEVPDGGTIPDVVGGEDGVLTLGGGSWENWE